MRIRVSGVLAVCAIGSFGLQLSSQSALTGTETVLHQPYTAEFRTTSVKTLANGTTISRESTEVRAVDSQGRTMTSTTIPETNGRPQNTIVVVFDPVAGTRSNWTLFRHEATVWKTVLGGQTRGCATNGSAGSTLSRNSLETVGVLGYDASGALGGSPSGSMRAKNALKRVTEDLGVSEIQGIQARGKRTTTTTPAGAVGNDEPLVRVQEIWRATAPGLGSLVVQDSTVDPQTGTSARELLSVSLTEPEAAAFQPPDGYEIKEQEARPNLCAGAGVSGVAHDSPAN